MTVQHDFQTDIRDHGDTQLELKSHFPLASDRLGKYALDAWFFVPATLGMNEKNYGVEGFFSDINSLTRFSASRVPLSCLIDPDCDVSPLVRIRKEMTSAAMPRDINSKRILYELRSLASIYNSESADACEILISTIAEGKLSIIKDTIKTHLKETKVFLEQWRDLFSFFLNPGISAEIRSAYDWTDESIGITTERFLFNLHGSIESDEESKSLLKRIHGLMDQEREYRKTMGYRILAEDAHPEEIEKRIYRESILKKWGQSVLYLNHEESATRRNMNHLLAGFAAAIAMGFAVIATIFAGKRFPGQSLPWAVAIIIAYIFKDRIKESLRSILIHTLPSLVSDERIRLIDQASGRHIGRVSSRVRFLKSHSAPAEIARLNDAETMPFRKILPEEDLIHFRREFIIRNRILRKHHTRLDKLADIVRLNLESFLHNMDNPEKTIRILSEDRPTELHGHRIYPVNLIISLTRGGSSMKHFFRYRIILDRTGLRRIETVD